VDQCAGMMCIGVMQVPFSPTYGWARKLATPAWFVTSGGEAMRTGPSSSDDHEFVDKENTTLCDPTTLIWTEGDRVNPEYRKEGCEMVVDTQSGQVSWFEADRLTFETKIFQGPDMVLEFVDRVTAMIYRRFGGTEMMEYYLHHIEKVGMRQEKNETWEGCYERSVEDGFWESLDEEFPAPNLTALGYKRYDTPEEINAEIAAAARIHAREVAEKFGLPASYAEEQPQLCHAELLASLQALKYGDNWFMDLSTNCEPSEVRMEMDRALGTLHVRIDDRRESFMFHNVPPDARPFVNLWLLDDQVSLPDYL